MAQMRKVLTVKGYYALCICIIHNILYILPRINNFGASGKSCCNFNFRCARTPVGTATKTRRGKGGKNPRSLARQFEGLQVEPADVGPSAPSVDASLNATFSTSVASTPTDHSYSRDRTSIAPVSHQGRHWMPLCPIQHTFRPVSHPHHVIMITLGIDQRHQSHKGRNPQHKQRQ